VELLKEKIIGEVRFVRASFGFQAKMNSNSRLFSDEFGGGAILDVGCYPVSMARLIAGVVSGGESADPEELQGTGTLCETGVDERAAAVLRFPNGLLAAVETAITVKLDNQTQIFGSEGEIIVPQPWVPARDGGKTVIIVKRKDAKEPAEIIMETAVPLYAWEADCVAENLSAKQGKFPAMSLADTLGNMRTLDRWRSACKLTYKKERLDAVVGPVGGRPLRIGDNVVMKYGRIAGLDKPISRLVLGVDNQRTLPHAAVMFDDFFMRGGNCFDTAHIYGSGLCEKILGKWIKDRGIREQTVILDKGAHTPFCDPQNLSRQLLESLDRLQTDYADIYMLHRDNPGVPVGEFIEALNEHWRAGRIRIFGCSNWTPARVEAANTYAQSKGLRGFSAVSNQFSLARMSAVPWEGCLSAGDEESSAWFKRTGMPLMAWSSQGRGFFLPGKARPADLSNKELVRCFYREDNFQRLKRAEAFAAKRGCEAVQAALAFVLCQPFPTFPLIGPRTISETKSSCKALTLKLTPEEVAWLDHG
jgi:aryl-alcohol dehydrogenase-like predicted oxidoreductase